MKRYYLIFDGQVQGVGFRSFFRLQAIQNNCTGWVRNMLNGKVEAELQGDKENLDQILRTIRQGSHFIKVHDFFIKEIPVIEEKQFTIRY